MDYVLFRRRGSGKKVRDRGRGSRESGRERVSECGYGCGYECGYRHSEDFDGQRGCGEGGMRVEEIAYAVSTVHVQKPGRTKLTEPNIILLTGQLGALYTTILVSCNDRSLPISSSRVRIISPVEHTHN